VPAVTVVVLGVLLFQQDRDLSRTRRGQQLESAADRAVRALDQSLGELTLSLSSPAWNRDRVPAGSIGVTIDDADVQVEPASAVAWYPRARPLDEPPPQVFAELDAAEHRLRNLPDALAISRRLAATSDPSIHATALLRQAAVLRKLQRMEDAVAIYRQLVDVHTVAVNGEPIDLVARRTLCELASSAPADRRTAAIALQADLDGGRWLLDRMTYEHVASQLDRWLGSERARSPEREALAAGVEWLWRLHTTAEGLDPTGRRTLLTDAGLAVTIIWAASPARVNAMVALPAYVDRIWRVAGSTAASPATVALEAEGVKAPGRNGEAAVRRSGDTTGLPWTVTASFPPGAEPDDLSVLKPTLVAGLVAILTLVGACAFVVFRIRRQEIGLMQLQSDFVSAVSHEFRTPLTALRQFNGLLELDGELPAEKRREYHRGQVRATERLHRLVESVLDFGRMEAGQRPYEFQPIDAGALVRDVVEEFKGENNVRDFDFRCSIANGDLQVQADPEALGLAIWNLLDNAVKYSRDRREVDVSVGRNAGAIAIAVRDHGIGIPRDEQQRIFQKFVRGSEATGARIKGTGIGLAIAQHVVSAHHGQITVASEPGHGSTFTIVLS
jgi:signal transduction histidine kinase